MTICTRKSVNAQNSDNYYVIRDSLESYYNSHPSLKQEVDGEYAQFIRWEEFWKDRVYGGDQSAYGSLRLFGTALKDYLNNISYFQRPTLIGSDWHCLGPDIVDTFQYRGKVMSVFVDTAIDHSMNTIYLGTEASGIWKTTDGGSNWHNVTDPSGIPLLGIRDITGDPNNGNIIYAATGFYCMDPTQDGGIGIIKSTDGGVTWQQLLTFDPVNDKVVYKILVDPFNSQRIYALVDSALLRNNNAGVGNWDTLFKCPNVVPGERRNLRSILMKPGDNNTLYVASEDRKPDASSTNKAKVYKITNATSLNINNVHAQSLDELFIPSNETVLTQRFQIAVTPADSSAIYVGCQQIIPQGSSYKFYIVLWKYDNINLWNKRFDFNEDTLDNGFNGVGFDKISILVSPSDTGVVYVGGIDMNRLFHWHFDYSTADHLGVIHADIRDAKIYQISPADSGKNDIIYLGHDGGISKNIGGLNNWLNLNGNGLVISEFNGIGSVNKSPGKIYGGSQDDELFSYTNSKWKHDFVGGDDGTPCVDYVDPDTAFIPAFVGGNIFRTTDGFRTWGPNITSGFTENHIANIPIVINPQNHKSIYLGYHNLWKSIQDGDIGTFTQMFIPPAFCNNCNDGIRDCCIAPTDSNTIYVGYDKPITSGGQQVKFVKETMTNNGLIWTDLTQKTSTFNHLLSLYGITSIEVSPTNKDSVWITFGGFLNQGDPNHVRVMISADGGNTWDSLYSAGLPNTPINCIKYMKGNGGRLFVGTDVGVFYRDKYCTEWQSFNMGLPTCIVTNLAINDNTQKIRAGTFGRGLYETDLTCTYNDTLWEIKHNVTLLHDTAVDQSIIIDSTYTFTVKAKLKLPPLGTIYVQPGAKLIVDGGTLTNRCYNMWRGIAVRSNPRLKQNTFNQGYVNFKNGAVLENARIGISTNGGLIVANNSIFRNNYNAVKFETYPYDQLSNFTKVTFETTNNYLDTNYAVPQDFVSLWNVKGVSFKGCTFQNTTVPADSVPGSLKGRGIYSNDATFYVDQYEYCPVKVFPCPNPQDTPSKFKGLYYGIRVYNSDPTKFVQIRNSIFDRNYRGIYLGASNNSIVTQNKFLVPDHTQAGNDTCYGLYLGTSSGYHVEANNFTSPGDTLLQSGSFSLREIGLIVDNSGGSPNEIYRNHFDTLDIAINAQRVNRQDGGGIPDGPGGGVPYPNGNPSGLVIKCNTYNNNSYDEMATRYNPSDLEGIAKYQGAYTSFSKDQAGNTFSPYHAQAKIQESDIKNLANNIIYYRQIQSLIPGSLRVDPFYHTPVPSVVDTLVHNTFIYDTCCPSQLPSPNPIPLYFKRSISQETNLIDSLLTVLKNLVDGGNTDGLNNTVNLSSPPDALDVHQDLLNSSPYLSDTVMKSAIDKESVLPNEMIRDVLVANPQSAKNEDVLNTLNDRSVPMPDSMMTEIMNGKDQLSPKEELEAQVALHMEYYKEAFNNLVLFYQTDSISSQTPDSLINFLGSIGDLDGKYMLAFEYLSKGDTINMENTLNSISSYFTLDKGQQAQYQDYLSYFSFLKTLMAQNKDILQIDSSQVVQLLTLYGKVSEPVLSFIRNILIANNVFYYYEPIIIPDETKSEPVNDQIKTSHISKGCSLKVFPNPSDHYIIAEYNTGNISFSNNEFFLTIVSLEGRTVESRIIEKPQDQVLIITNDYKPGIYFCSLKSGNKIFITRKFTVIQ